MIRIHKPKTPPKILAVEGKEKQKQLCDLYSENPSLYETGTKKTKAEKQTIKKFEFASSIYGHPTVKQALIEAQYQKCCFCESKIGIDGDIEHFRPKGAYKQGRSLHYPGYYWLAYEWDNLYLSCTGCNQRQKQNHFPLEDPTKRATNHTQSLDLEQPLFIDLGKENPEEFIFFHGEIAHPVNQNKRGRVTIDSLGLNETKRSLPEKRLEHLAQLKMLDKIFHLAAKQPKNLELQELAIQSKIMLEKSLLDSAEFASAARCAINSKFQGLPA